jgi:hypothetical protein
MVFRPDKVEDETVAQAKLIKSLLPPREKDWTKAMSELNDEEILTLTLLYTWSKATGVKIISYICDLFLLLRMSKFRLGRRETALVSSIISTGGFPTKKSWRDLLTMRI